MLKAVVKAFVLLCILFVMVYVGINNIHQIDFNFPVVRQKPIHAIAALIYFGVFAVGLLAGTVVTAGGGKAGKRNGGGGKDK